MIRHQQYFSYFDYLKKKLKAMKKIQKSTAIYKNKLLAEFPFYCKTKLIILNPFVFIQVELFQK